MQRDIRPLELNEDRDLGWVRSGGYGWSRDMAFCPIHLQELPILLGWFAIAFQKRGDGTYVPGAVLGLHEGENLMVAEDGSWHANHVPATLRAYPFALQQIRNGDEVRMALAFDHASGLFRENASTDPDAIPFFENGELREGMQNLIKFLKSWTLHRQRISAASKALAEEELFVPWEVSMRNPDPDRALLPGLHRISEEAFRKVSPASLKRLQEIGALKLVYGHMASSPRLGALSKLYLMRYRTAAAKQAAADPRMEFLSLEEEGKIDFDL